MSDQTHDQSHGHEYHSHGKLYFTVFAILCGLTLVSILTEVIHIPKGPILVGIVMSVSLCKALCVMMIFMHLKFERAWKYMLLAPTLILAATIPFALIPDIGTHYYPPTAPQIYEYEARQAAGGGDAHGHPAAHSGDDKPAPETKH